MRLNTMKIDTYLKMLASNKPVPGGGSASAVVGAIGIALAEMVANIILKRKSPQRKLSQLKMTVNQLEQFRVKVEEIIDKDARIYARLHKAYLERNKRSEKSIADCLSSSFDIMILLVSFIGNARQELDKFKDYRGKSLLNDLILSKMYLDASLKGAFMTAQINVDYMPDKQRKQNMQTLLKVMQRKFK